MGVPTVYMVGTERLALVPEYLNLGSVVIIAPDQPTLRTWQEELSIGARPVAEPESTPESTVVIDMAGRRIVHDGASLPLSDLEFQILGALLEESGRAWSFRELRRVGWHDATELPVDPYAVKAAIQRLRAKLEVAGAPITIEAVRGYGFRAVHRDEGSASSSAPRAAVAKQPIGLARNP